MKISKKLPTILAASGILVITAGVSADMQGLCIRNDPAWIYVNPPGGCTSNAQCIQEKHTTGSQCQYGPIGWCQDITVLSLYYIRQGSCISDPGGNYCDFTNVSWTEITDDPDFVTSCHDYDDSMGGGITN